LTLEAAFAAAHVGDPGTAQLAVYRDGELIVDLWSGRPDSIGIVMSCTKGVVAVAAHLLVERGALSVEAPVVEYWPEFSARTVTVAHVLSHTAGLAGFVPADPLDFDRCVRALARMRPAWEPGRAVTYHSLSWGWLVGELIRRVTGLSVGAFVAQEIARPLGLDLWIGLPQELEPRVAPQLDDGFPIARMLGTRAARAAEIPAANAVTDARSLARMYAALLGPVGGGGRGGDRAHGEDRRVGQPADGGAGVRLLSPATVDRAREPRTDGLPLVGVDDPHAPRFGLGFELPRPGNPMLGPTSFGHAGAGGRLAFADVASGLAVGYTCTAMRWRPERGPDPRWPPLLEAIRREC
jgi:CubicO group peptidase (beta-lactamase class C family)